MDRVRVGYRSGRYSGAMSPRSTGLADDDRTVQVITPIGDGLTLIRPR